MAKQPKFYPNLPRDKQKPKGRRVGAICVNTPVRVPRMIQADNLYKPTKVYTPNLIKINTMETFADDTRSGTKNPGWRVTIAKGGDASSPYSREQYSLKPTRFTVRTEGVNNLSFGSGTLFGGLIKLQNSTVALDNRAIGILRNKANGKVGNAKLGPPLAESREIHRLVRQINGLGMETFKALLAAKKTKGASISKQFGNIWLGFGFGVNPLLHDLQAAAEAIQDYVTRMDHRAVIRGTAKTEYNSGFIPTASSEYIAQDCTIAWYRNARHTQSIRYVAGIDITVEAGSSYSVGDHLGLKVEALPSILWELTPYSWAIDYVTTVGAWLDDMFYAIPVKVVYLNKSYKYQSETLGIPRVYLSAGTTAGFSGTTSVGRYTNFVRTVHAPVLPTRTLAIKSADEIASHGLTKLLNLGSVVAGRFGPRLGTRPTHQFREKINPL